MWPLILTLGSIGAGLAVWSRASTGQGAWRACLRHPVVFLPAASVWAFTWLIDDLDLGDLEKPFLNVNSSGIRLAISVCLLLLMAAHVVALSWVLHLVQGRMRGRPAQSIREMLPVSALSMAGLWCVLFALLIPVTPIIAVRQLTWPALFVLAVLYVGVNLLAATMLSRWPARCSEVGVSLRQSALWLRAGGYRRLLPTVALHCVLIGVATLVWLDGYTKVVTKRTGGFSWSTETTTFDKFNFSVHAEGVLGLTVRNPWPRAVADGVEEPLPKPLRLSLGLLTALLSVVFLVAYSRVDGTAPPLASPIPATPIHP